ncbi:MAG: class I SAM-dependent methyltransferase [Rhodospirillales bacterium]|nr:class I SAM-dependent methyltransferase [Rhodospirillales bacterium]
MKPVSSGLMLVVLGAMLATPVNAQSDLTDKIRAALQQPHRSEANRARDRNRDPARAMQFCRLGDDMKVIEFAPGRGWYTEILGPVLKDRGELHIAFSAARLARLDDKLKLGPLSKVRKLPIPVTRNPTNRKFVFRSLEFGTADADLLLNIREYHNIDPDSVAVFNRGIYAALKPGGYYCIIDHTRRHMAPDERENRRRMDPVLVIRQVQRAGFRLVDFTDLFFRPDDELRYEVGRRTVAGNTDRFTLLFQKPGG